MLPRLANIPAYGIKLMKFLQRAGLTEHDFSCKMYFSAIVERECYDESAVEKCEDVQRFEDIPGPKSRRFVGTLPKYIPYFGDYSMDALHKNAFLNYKRYGTLVREQIVPSVNLLHVFDPNDMEIIFRNEGRLPDRRSHLALAHYRSKKPDVYNTGGLLATNGPEWWRLRSTFQKNMTSPQSVKTFISKTDNIVEEFLAWIGEIQKQNDIIEDFLPLLNRLYLEIIVAVTFDIRLNSFTAEEQKATSISSRLILSAFESNSGILKLDHGFLWKLFNTPLYIKLSQSQIYLEKFASDVLAHKLSFFESAEQESATGFTSLMDMFLRHPNVDMKDIVGMMVDILMAGIDTTSYSTSFLLYHLARNPLSQQKLLQEGLELLPEKSSPVTNDALNKAIYARSCIKESLRLNPVSIGVGRVLHKNVVLSGYRVPKGTVIVTQNMIASRLHQYCKDPQQFKPERWIRNSEEHENLHPFLSLPFGFGPRSCIARRLAEQTICMALLKMVRNFEFTWCDGELDVKTLLINKPNQPVNIKTTKRNL